MSLRSRLTLVLSLFATALLALPAALQAAPRAIPGELIVKYRQGAGPNERALARRNINATLDHAFRRLPAELVRFQGMTVEQAIERMERNPLVEYAEPNWEIQAELVPNDPRFPELYGLRNTGQTGGTAGADIHAVNAWDVFTGNPNLKIGVIDTGVDYTHPDLAANSWVNAIEQAGTPGVDDDGNGYVDDIRGYDFVNNDGNAMDDNGHGTHCAGTIAGVGNNGVGVTGVNWQAKIVPIKFLSAGGSGSTAGAIDGVEYAIAVGVAFTSNSWGGGGFSQALLDAINLAGAANQLFIAAAGNSSSNNDVSPHYPSSYNAPNIVAVAATDHNDNLASFSSFGATSVDIAAPGVAILSCQPGGGYQLLSGTSMATPHVAGVAGLVYGRFPGITYTQVKTLLLTSADVKPQLTGKVLTNGRLNALMSIADPDETPPGGVSDLATTTPLSNSMGLSWTATGDDGNTGRASRYEIRFSTALITDANFGSATLANSPDPQPAGSAETFEVGGLTPNTAYFFALKAFDEFGNAGPLSNVATGTTSGAPDAGAAPVSFTEELTSGQTSSQALVLTNTGAGNLDWSVPTPELMFAQPIQFEYQEVAKEEDDVRVGLPVIGSAGGPDGFGYRWSDSNEPNGPAYSWVDITGVGTAVSFGSTDDSNAGPFPIGFNFPYYGNSHASVRICTNGWLSFNSTSTAYGNQPLPNAGAPDNLVAPLWDDLILGGGTVYYHNDGSRFIVTWSNVSHYGSGGPYSFQAILYPTGEIRFQYQDVNAPNNSATAGIQNGTRDIGLTVAFNTAYLGDNLAVRISPLAQWLTVSPTSGRLFAGQSQNLSVNFNTAGLLGGNYYGNVKVFSNDPAGSPLSLPAHLHVIGAPDIAVNPTTMDFPNVFVGATPTQNLVVSNPGTDDIVVSSIVSGDPTVTVSPSNFTVTPQSQVNVTVQYAPTSVSTLNTTLTVNSNDPDEAAVVVAVTGAGVAAPVAVVTPSSLAEALFTGQTSSHTLRIDNTGGSPFNFTAQAVAFTSAESVPVYGEADHVEIPKGGEDVQFGITPDGAGGPDVFGYTWKDSDEPGGPAFNWVDIRPMGTQIVMNGDDQNTGPYPIGFNFPFYGTPFSSFRISTNGFISFTSTLTSLTNTNLPSTSSSAPPNLLAAFWDDLHFRGVNCAWYYYDGARLIIQYQDVRRYSEGASGPTNTFQIILYPSGAIMYQYLSMNATTKNSCTIGIQNATKTDGFAVVYNANYVHDNLAIRIAPPARFLNVTPTAGTIGPGGFMDLTVGFDATGLFGGLYEGAVRLVGNDPVLPSRDISANLTVTGVPDIAATPSPLDFGTNYLGVPEILPVTVINTGTDVLQVEGVEISGDPFGVFDGPFNVPPLGSASLNVSFAPTTAGTYNGTLTLRSNDPDEADLVVPLTGVSIVPPEIGVSPALLKSALAPQLGPVATTETKSLVIENTGGSDLDWTATALNIVTTGDIPEAVEREKDEPEVENPPVIEGSGGPDAAGYIWIDSDAPNGPAFSWVDISAVGTPLALTGDDQNVGPIALPFPFKFYGNTYNSIRACTNGWLSFTSTATTFSNAALPTGGSSPENLIAAFWDDLNFASTTLDRAWTHYDGTRFIITYENVPHYGTPAGGPYTFQTILYPSGMIEFQYLTMGTTRLNEATIGIQNATKTVGLQVVHNAAYVHDNLRVRILPLWLSVSPTAGTTPAGESDTVQVTFNAEGLPDGDYDATVRIASNDLDEPQIDVPAHLHVGVAPIGFDLDPNSLNAKSNGNWVTAIIEAPTPYSPTDVDPASMLLERQIALAPGAPMWFDGQFGYFKFPRRDLQAILPVGNAVPVELICEVPDVTWCRASDVIRVLPPRLTTGTGDAGSPVEGPIVYTAGQLVPLRWEPPVEGTPTHYELWLSTDLGATWTLMAGNLTTRDYEWMVPNVSSTDGLMDLIAYDENGPMGAFTVGPFTITSGVAGVEDGVPQRLGLQFAGPNPSRAGASLKLGMPARGTATVRVYDVRGALVHELHRGELEAGFHTMRWNGADASGREVGAGVYFIRAELNGQTAGARFALVR